MLKIVPWVIVDYVPYKYFHAISKGISEFYTTKGEFLPTYFYVLHELLLWGSRVQMHDRKGENLPTPLWQEGMIPDFWNTHSRVNLDF